MYLSNSNSFNLLKLELAIVKIHVRDVAMQMSNFPGEYLHKNKKVRTISRDTFPLSRRANAFFTAGK